MNGFKRIIQKINRKAKVLDVGAWGLEGENTSQYIEERFKNVVFMNIKAIPKVTLVDDFYKHKFSERFDLIVLDMPQKNNTERDWTNKGLKRVAKLLRDGGIFITFLQTEQEYQDVDASKLFDLFAIYPENRRKDIIWIALKRKQSGL